MPIRLECVTPALATTYRDIRLRALQDSPLAFGRTYAEESRFTEANWLTRAASCDGIKSIALIAFDEEEPCGLIRCHIGDGQPDQAQVTSMWIAPASRRAGLGSQLLHAVELWAAEREVSRLLLMVVSNNKPAIRFYQQNGFALTSRTEPYPPDSKLLEHEMSKSLH